MPFFLHQFKAVLKKKNGGHLNSGNTIVPIKTYADNACCDGYWHFIMSMLSIFVKERFSRILEYVYSNVHEHST